MSAIRSLVRGIISVGTPARLRSPANIHANRLSSPSFTLLPGGCFYHPWPHVEVLAECVMPRWQSPGVRQEVPRAETGFIFIGNIESVTQTGEECPTVPSQLPDCVKLQDSSESLNES